MTQTHATAPNRPAPAADRSSLWMRIGALIYDPFLRLGELTGMRAARRALLADAAGHVVEIGAGTGLNLPYVPAAAEGLTLIEPEPAMRRRLERRIARLAPGAELVAAPAEHLPLPDDSVDTVVCTLVLCTVDDPMRALAEIARVLRPGGQLLFIEHVRSHSRLLAWWQDRLMRPWRGFAGGCRCNRPTLALMRESGFEVDADTGAWHGMPLIVRPLSRGRARVRASG